MKAGGSGQHYPLTNSVVIMEGKEFMVFDYIRKEWQKGESIEEVLDHFDILEKVHEGIKVDIDQLKIP
jgi:hypothetical protein